MRAGQRVRYLTGTGQVTGAVVTAVTGAGPSGWKALDLDVGGVVRCAVPHLRDRIVGEGCWLADGDAVPAEVPAARRPITRSKSG